MQELMQRTQRRVGYPLAQPGFSQNPGIASPTKAGPVHNDH